MTTTKHEWRKVEKNLYLPKIKPEFIDIPELNFITINGQGNPNGKLFSECIGALYSVSYTIKMGIKKFKAIPEGYYDYTVYPLEGVWDLKDEAKSNFNGSINKDDLVYKLMIRQPDFVNEQLFSQMLELTHLKKPSALLKNLHFEKVQDGKCIQMLHIGSFDDEAASFKIMEDYADNNKFTRLSKTHREIYLSDFRKVDAEKLKTVLRFRVK